MPTEPLIIINRGTKQGRQYVVVIDKQSTEVVVCDVLQHLEAVVNSRD
jgi:hypothetical protein